MNKNKANEMTEKQMEIENNASAGDKSQQANNDRSHMNNTKCNTAASVGDGFWITSEDDNDRRLQEDAALGKTRIIFDEQFCSLAWCGIASRASEEGFSSRAADNASNALARYERIMWLSRPKLLEGEARVILFAMHGVFLQLCEMTVGLKNDVYMSVHDCEMEYPGLYQEWGVDRSILLTKVNAMTPIEIFSLLHSAEAYYSSDSSEGSLDKYFNIIVDNEGEKEG